MSALTEKLLDKPKIISIVAETNQGKSNLIYHILLSLIDEGYLYNLHTYGLRHDLGDREHKIFSVDELETITNSVIVCDEFYALFDLEDRKARKAIENSLRLISHNNNILILAGLPDNFKKFISAKTDIFIYKKCKIRSFINGSQAKYNCTDYKGAELGSTVLNLKVNEALIYDTDYSKIVIPYLKDYDTKKDNVKIVRKENVPQNAQKNHVPKNVRKMCLPIKK